MFQQINQLFSTNTGKDTAIVFISTIINVAVGGVFFIIAPRLLGPGDYGIFSTVISTAVLSITIANFGIDTGILRFASKKSKEFDEIITLALKAYLLLSTIVTILGFLLAPLIADFIKIPESTNLLKIAFAGSIFILLSNFFIASLQSKGDFLKASLVSISSNVVRLAILLIGLTFLRLDLYWLTIIFFISPIASVLSGMLAFPIKFKEGKNIEMSNFFRFNFYIAVALIISQIPYENYILLNIAGKEQTGLFSAPFKILTFAYMFGGNFTRVLASRFSSFDTREKAIMYAKKALPIAMLCSLLVLSTIPFANLIIKILFGESFQGSVAVYRMLAVGFSVFFLSTIPSSIIIYYLGKSKVSFMVTAARYVIYTLLLLLLVPKYFAQGAAIAFVLSEMFSLVAISTYVMFRLKK